MNKADIQPRSTYEVLTAPEAAAAKGVHRNSVLKAIRKGHLQARKSGRSWIIDRLSLERWEPRASRRDQPLAAPSTEPPSPSLFDQTAGDREVRTEKLMRLLDQWMADESSDDAEAWPKLEAVLEQNRLSSRPLFKATPK